ncbi:hypothetical protein QOZ80_1AG0029240 [Eleusine coracana subsp. coracana]|nr:hypothetical protein QOZ80_1AG0029240 [Eleusine coracana subsp. coracana]
MEQPGPCGNVTIKYPFYWYKSGFPLVNNSSYCGYPGLGIQCEDGEDGQSAVLQLGNQKYNVLNISYTDLTVSVVDQLVSVKDDSCPSISHNVTLPRNSWLSYPNDTVDYLHFFLNCSLDTTSPSPTSRVNCSFAGPSYVLPRREVPPGDWWQACRRIVEAPVLRSTIPIYAMNDSRWRNGGYGIALRQGFQLTWDQKPPACDLCERSDGWCGYNQAGEFTGCFCSDGQVDTHNCSSGKLFQACTQSFSPN